MAASLSSVADRMSRFELISMYVDDINDQLAETQLVSDELDSKDTQLDELKSLCIGDVCVRSPGTGRNACTSCNFLVVHLKN